MPVKFDGVVETKISNLIENQFPNFYHEEGPVFIEFVKQYYDWLESESWKRKDYISPGKSTVQVTYGNNEIIGTATSFKSTFSVGDKIAIESGDDDYRLFDITSIANNSHLTVNEDHLPTFANENANYAQTIYKPNPTYYNRRLLSNIDVDRTIDDFIVFFKEQYLNNIQLDTITSTTTLIKHSLDLYRSKGTERGLQLLFRIAYGITPKVYHPHTDLFRFSDGDYFEPTYLELQPKESTALLSNKKIIGVHSGATAFVDSVIRRTISGKIIDVAYISAIEGNFETGEYIITSDGSVDVLTAPAIVGSLNSITLPASGQGTSFNVGDSLKVKSASGDEAEAIVSELASATGVISVELEDGGYGYTGNSIVEVSEAVLVVNNVVPNLQYYSSANSYIKNKDYVELEDVVTQPKAGIIYNSTTANFASENVYSYHANGDVDGTGYIYNTEPSNTTAGVITVSVISGNLETGNALYTESNTITANVTSYDDYTAVANVMGTHNNVSVYVTMLNGKAFEEDEKIVSNFGNGYVSGISIASGEGVLTLRDNRGIYAPGKALTGETSGARATVDSITLAIGVKDVSNTFITDSNNYLTFSGGANASILSISNGAGFTFEISNNFLYPETLTSDISVIDDYDHIDLDAATYGFPSLPTGNLTNAPILSMIQPIDFTVGKIQALININPGIGYNVLPIVNIKEPQTFNYKFKDSYRIRTENVSARFIKGELVTQEATGARGLVYAVNDDRILIESLKVEDDDKFIRTTNSTLMIIGDDSGTTANATAVHPIEEADYIGLNARVSLTTTSSNNSIKSLNLVSSGFGFIDGESINAYSNSESIFGSAVVETHGTAKGFYRDQNGFLSDIKKLHDGLYWQQFSYEIRSSLALDVYQDMLREIMHVAGTSNYANLVNETVSSFTFDSNKTQTEITTT